MTRISVTNWMPIKDFIEPGMSALKLLCWTYLQNLPLGCACQYQSCVQGVHKWSYFCSNPLTHHTANQHVSKAYIMADLCSCTGSNLFFFFFFPERITNHDFCLYCWKGWEWTLWKVFWGAVCASRNCVSRGMRRTNVIFILKMLLIACRAICKYVICKLAAKHNTDAGPSINFTLSKSSVIKKEAEQNERHRHRNLYVGE